jgi:hypothetical protein
VLIKPATVTVSTKELYSWVRILDTSKGEVYIVVVYERSDLVKLFKISADNDWNTSQTYIADQQSAILTSAVIARNSDQMLWKPLEVFMFYHDTKSLFIGVKQSWQNIICQVDMSQSSILFSVTTLPGMLTVYIIFTISESFINKLKYMKLPASTITRGSPVLFSADGYALVVSFVDVTNNITTDFECNFYITVSYVCS